MKPSDHAIATLLLLKELRIDRLPEARLAWSLLGMPLRNDSDLNGRSVDFYHDYAVWHLHAGIKLNLRTWTLEIPLDYQRSPQVRELLAMSLPDLVQAVAQGAEP